MSVPFSSPPLQRVSDCGLELIRQHCSSAMGGIILSPCVKVGHTGEIIIGTQLPPETLDVCIGDQMCAVESNRSMNIGGGV